MVFDYDKNVCFICRGRATETHHIMNGSTRLASELYGYTIRVCRRCHNNIHQNYSLRESLKKMAEEDFLKDHSLEEWMAIFHKNYL